MQNDLRELAEQQDGILYIEQVESWIEEIVELLEGRAVERFGNLGMGGELVVNLDDAIDIVKGGVDNAERFYDVEKAKTPTPTHPIPLDTQICIQELESRYEMILKRMEEYEYTHLIEHDSEQAKHCEGADDCEYSDCLLCLWAKAKAIVRNGGKE